MLPRAIHSERDKLDLQRSRIEEILSHRIVSAEMEGHLRQRVDDISKRLLMLDMSLVGAGRPALPVVPDMLSAGQSQPSV